MAKVFSKVAKRVGIVLLSLLLLLSVVGALLVNHYYDERAETALSYALKLTQSFSQFASASPDPEQSLSPLLANVYARNYTSLNGQWRFLIDQRDDGDRSILYRGGIGRDRRPVNTEQMYESGFDHADTIEVPGDWNSQRPELFWYQGVIWYQRDFEFNAKGGERQYLYIGAANQHADVYLNGHLVARHSGGFTPFNAEVSDYLQPTNRLIIKVDSRGRADDVPGEIKDWLDYGGLTRDVLLLHVPDSHIENYKIQLAADSLDRVAGWLQLTGDKLPETAEIRIPELGLVHRVDIDESGRGDFDFAFDGALWRPGAGRLYDVEIVAGDDQLRDRIGFRSVASRGPDILVNGEPVFLRGAAVHEVWLDRPGRAHGAQHGAALMARLADLNANYVRLAHYPHDEFTLRAADEAGVMVWSEIPMFNKIAFDNPQTRSNALQQLSEMIVRDHNRASVLFWSIGNETPDSDARNDFMAALAERARGLDDTRLISAAIEMSGALKSVGLWLVAKLSGYETEPPVLSMHDPLAELIDVIGYNEYVGWYGSGFLSDMLETDEAELRRIMADNMASFSLDTPYGKPLVISEFGAGAKRGFRGDKRDVWSEDYQQFIYQQQFKLMANSPALRGVSAWNLKDFHSPGRMNSTRQDYFNRKGLLSETGEPKLAYFALQDFYRQLAEQAPRNPAQLEAQSQQ